MGSDVLTGAKAIAEELGVSPGRIGALAAQGAPVKVLGEGRGRRYLASRAGLIAWLRELPRSSSIFRELS